MAVNVVIALYYYLAWTALLFARPRAGCPPAAYRISWSDGLAVGVALGAALWLSGAPQLVLRFG